MNNDQTRPTNFETQYGSEIPEPFPASWPALTESTFAFPRSRPDGIHRPLPPFDFSAPNTLDSISSKEFTWSPEDDNHFAGVASGQQCFGNVASVATTTRKGDEVPPWNTTISVKGHETSGNAPGCWQQCSNPQDCNASALKTLRTVHVAAEECLSRFDDGVFRVGGLSCLDGEVQHSRTMDVVLSQLEEASAVASTILKCSCRLRVQLQMLVATILERLVSWCSAIIQSTATDSGMSDRQRREKVSPQTITIGTHQLDKTLEVRVIVHVVTGKLQKLENLIEELSGRIEESNTAAGAKNGTTSVPFSLREVGLLEIIRDRLIDCLRAQIIRARGDLGRLRMSNLEVVT